MLAVLENLLTRKIKGLRRPYDHPVQEWCKEFEVHIDEIQSEWKQYVKKFQSYGLPIDDLSKEQRSLNEDKKWKSLFLFGYSHFNEKELIHFPRTAELIWKHKHRVTLAMFSTTEAGKHIPAHTGNNSGVLRVQIGVDISDPEGCVLRVEDKKIQLKEKEIFIFDDTFEHELINDSQSNRTVLIIDYYKPLPFFYHVLNKKKISGIAKSDYVHSVVNKIK